MGKEDFHGCDAVYLDCRHRAAGNFGRSDGPVGVYMVVIGGIAALVTSIFTDVIWIQLTVFVAVSILSLLITRPLVKKAMSFQKEDTNAGRIVGQKGIVTEAVENDQGKGQVNVSGSIWTARSMDQTVIPKGASVLVDAIEGVKLIVHPIEEKE